MGSFTEEESFFSSRKLIIGLGGVALVILLVIAAPFAFENFRKGLENSPFSGRATPDKVIAELESAPELREMITAFRTHYPEDYRAYAQRLAAAINEGGRPAAEQAAARYVDDFLRSKLRYIANAPSRDLQRIAESVADFHEALGRSRVDTCADYFMGRGPANPRIPAEVRPYSLRLVVLQFRAARHGEDGKAIVRGEPTDADNRAWLARATQIDPPAGALLSSGNLDGASPVAQCDAAIAMYRGVAALPVDQSAKVMANFLRQAAAQR